MLFGGVDDNFSSEIPKIIARMIFEYEIQSDEQKILCSHVLRTHVYEY